MCYFDWQKSFFGLSEIGVNCSVYLYVLFVHVSLNVMHSYTDTTQLGDGDIPGNTRNDRAVHCWTSLCFFEVNTFYSYTLYVKCILIYLCPLIYPLNTIFHRYTLIEL